MRTVKYACAYARFEHEGKINCALIASKSRVAPLKPTSIPRLELQAALLGSRLLKHLRISLDVKIHKYILWSDSEVVLNWIRSSSRRFKVFVAQRLGEIQEIAHPSDWRYVPTKLNIADDVTKIKPINFAADSSWFKGLRFLYSPMEEWPQKNLHRNPSEVEEYEIEHVHLTTEVDKIELPDMTRFSNWYRLLRTTAWVLRFVNKIKKRTIRAIQNPNKQTISIYAKQVWSGILELQPDEISKSELLIYRRAQSDMYLTEIDCVRNQRSIPKLSPLLKFPIIITNDKLLRLSGRLDNADNDLSYESKHPIMLDPRHAVTTLIIKHHHNKNTHIGQETIISNLRKVYWITGCRNAVKKAAYDCQVCKIRKARPQVPLLGQLPSCRVNQTIRPFVKTGVDLFGPIEVCNCPP